MSFDFLLYNAAFIHLVLNKYQEFLREKCCSRVFKYLGNISNKKTSNVTLNTEKKKLMRKKCFLYSQAFFELLSCLAVFHCQFIWDKTEAFIYLISVWKKSNYLLYFGSTTVHFRHVLKLRQLEMDYANRVHLLWVAMISLHVCEAENH